MIKSFKLFESKQVGVIYHFTSIYSLYKILSFFGNSTKDPYIYSSYVNYVSCTRNFNMKSNELKLEKQCCRITLDGNKLSENFKIKPYLDPNYPEPEEREERVLTKDNVIDLKKYCLRIDILNYPVLDSDNNDGKYSKSAINSYTFEPNQYLDSTKEITSNYNRYIKKLKSLNSNLPIFFVDQMKPCKLNENNIEFDILPPKKKQNTGGNDYLYYVIFEEMFIPKNLVKLLSPTNTYPGGYIMKDIYNNNPYRIGIFEFKILPKYVDSKIIDGQKYDKIILNDYLKTSVRLTEEKIKEIHKNLIFNIFDKYNTENINLEDIIKFNLFSAFQNPQIDEDLWENIINGFYE